jgi:hypothetical protein
MRGRRRQFNCIPVSSSEEDDMKWALLGIAVWVLAFLFVLVLMRMASDQDRAAQAEERAMIQSRALLARLSAARGASRVAAEREVDGEPRIAA